MRKALLGLLAAAPLTVVGNRGINLAADLPRLIGLGFVDQQLHQGAGVTEEENQLNPDTQSRYRSATSVVRAASGRGQVGLLSVPADQARIHRLLQRAADP